MGHRTIPTMAETLGVMRHLADVASLRGDPPAQRQLLVDGLNRLFGTTMGWLLVMDDWRPGRGPTPVHAVLTSHLDPAWQRYCVDFAVHVPPTDDPYADHSLRSDDVEQQWELHRVLPDLAAHRRYPVAVQMKVEAGLADGAVCAFRAGPAGDRVVAVALHRCVGDPPIRAREYGLHRLALTELRRLVERGHVPLDQPASAALTPRRRQVLDCLLAGHAPKAIGRRLGLSVWTVRDHIKGIYAQLGVHGRDELMAQYIGRPPKT